MKHYEALVKHPYVANDVADAMGVSVDQEQTAAEIPTV